IVVGIGRVPENGYGSPEAAMEAAARAMQEREIALGQGEDHAPPPEGTLSAYLIEQIYDRRANPREDLITRLVQAEIDGRQLDDGELVSFLILILVAGNETTTNLINHSVRALATYPEEQTRLRADRSHMGAFIEEALRWESPIQGFYRRANRDVEVEGVPVKAGDALLVLFGAANRDPRKFECPADFQGDRFDAEQLNSRAHLAFGAGIHYCLGANLARIEAAIAVNGILDRFAEITPATDPEWFDTPFFRGPQSYVVNVKYA
ncbi:MAG: cytochrome P450, partial [Chloroflexi bacterium]|nr:cytochrome P450 [Chloroflexota bacterium]